MYLRNTHDMGLLLQSRRKTLGWSQAHLASQIGITRQWVIALEKGNPGVALGTVLKALTTLGLILDATPREPGTDMETVFAISDDRIERERSSSDIDEVIASARGEARDNLLILRQPLPLARARRKIPADS